MIDCRPWQPAGSAPSRRHRRLDHACCGGRKGGDFDDANRLFYVSDPVQIGLVASLSRPAAIAQERLI